MLQHAASSNGAFSSNTLQSVCAKPDLHAAELKTDAAKSQVMCILLQDGHFDRMRELIEHAVSINSGRPAVLVAHSMGGLVSLYFITRQSPEWRYALVQLASCAASSWHTSQQSASKDLKTALAVMCMHGQQCHICILASLYACQSEDKDGKQLYRGPVYDQAKVMHCEASPHL